MKKSTWVCVGAAIIVAYAALAAFTAAVVLVGPLLAVAARGWRHGARLPAVLTLLFCILALVGSPLTMELEFMMLLLVPGVVVAGLLHHVDRRRRHRAHSLRDG